MKQLLLATALIAAPVAVFSGVEYFLFPPAHVATAAEPSLGDMTPFTAIVTDTRSIAATGDLAAAGTRITDLETAWDQAEPQLRARAPVAWGNVDAAADAAFSALRARTPDPAQVTAALDQLLATLANPSGGNAAGPAEQVQGIDVTDAAGHPIACEAMLNAVRDGIGAGRAGAADRSKITDLQSRATERCNADDDRRADAFSAEALALMTPKDRQQ